MAKSKVTQYQRYQTVDGPDMKAPVKEGDLHGLFGGVDGFAGSGWRRGVVQHGFGHAKKQQGDAVASGKQHGKPGRKTVLRVCVIRPQFDMAPVGKGNADDKDQEESYRQHVEPAEGVGDIAQGGAEGITGQLGVADGADHQQQNHDDGGYKHRNKNAGAACSTLLAPHTFPLRHAYLPEFR